MASEARAYTAGIAYQVLVKVGDQVAKGQVVVVLESMKMEVPVEAPAAGTVAQLLVAEGDAVDENALIVVIE